MGGRGASSGSGRASSAGLNPNDILGTSSLVSLRETNRAEVDAVLGVFRDFNKEYGTVIGDIEVAQLAEKAKGVLGYYDGTNIAINQDYMNEAKMNEAMKLAAESGWHPSMGTKSGIEAVTAHEIGHQLTDAVGSKVGIYGTEKVATKIVNEARKKTGDRGVVIMAGKISRYATSSNAEAVAEAVADVYCNGSSASAQSKAIVEVMDGYLK